VHIVHASLATWSRHIAARRRRSGACGVVAAEGQQPEQQPIEPPPPAISVNWLYGAYVPKEVPLVPLSSSERRQLWVRQTFVTPCIYFKTGLFVLVSEPESTRRIQIRWISLRSESVA
jgi:hypothetical protein